MRIGAMVSVALMSAGALSPMGSGVATAAACPDVQAVFARGTGEAPGVGPTGQAFVDALRTRLKPGTSYDVYAVNYPASEQWSTGRDGVRDVGAHIVSMAADCPKTKMVLGGYSQGAAVAGFITSAAVPDGVDPASVPKPLDPEVADHVAALVLFATPNVRAMNFLGEPPVVIGPIYRDKTLQLCVANDGVCSDGLDFAAHDSYAQDAAVVGQGADFAAARLPAGVRAAAPVAPAPVAPIGDWDRTAPPGSP